MDGVSGDDKNQRQSYSPQVERDIHPRKAVAVRKETLPNLHAYRESDYAKCAGKNFFHSQPESHHRG